MSENLMPFRFSLSESCAGRWAKLSTEAKQAMLTAWLYDYWRSPAQQQPTQNKAVVVSVPQSLELVLTFAQQECEGLLALANSFSLYCTAQLSKGKPVRGELELTAEWAAATCIPHKLEVVCRAGRIDIVFEQMSLLIEAKVAGSWKHAIGQALSYKYCLGKPYEAGVLLLGKRLDSAYDGRLAEQVCASLGLAVFWYSGNESERAVHAQFNQPDANERGLRLCT